MTKISGKTTWLERKRLKPSLAGGALLLGALLAGANPQNGRIPVADPSDSSVQLTQRGAASGALVGLDGDPLGQETRIYRMNAARQRSMEEDTEKLFRYVSILKDQIAEENDGTLRTDQLRRLAEIEKLAHNIRDKMAMTYGGNPLLESPFGRPIR
jgi:hypothetical protein